MSHSPLNELLSQLAAPLTGELLFDALDDVVYFIKDERGRYVLVNLTLVRRCGAHDKSELLGRTAAEVFPPPLGDEFLKQDRALVATGEALLNELELHLYPTGAAGWCLTTKLPLKNRENRCIGLVGLSRDLHAPTEDYRDVAESLRQAQGRLDQTFTVDELARQAGLSAYQFDQRIREVFHVSATQLMLKFRMDRATQQLRDTDKPILQIALDCGYAEQSSFTRQFHRVIGLAPGEYRKRART
ncbi:MAG TPA: AraC family transcriptional regulator [Pirellulales bacterium]